MYTASLIFAIKTMAPHVGHKHKRRSSFLGSASNRYHLKRPGIYIWLIWIFFFFCMLTLLHRSSSLLLKITSKAQISVELNSKLSGFQRGVIVKSSGSNMTNTNGQGSTSPFEKPRLVETKLLSKEQPEGDGALVRRSIGRPELRNLDPFLLLDEFSVSPPAGFPDHPHRGFETVTYMLKWMTAGRGIVHCEMPASKGVQQGLQLWVNLSKKDKMIEPGYQELEDKDIPKVEKDGVRATVIAGEALGIKSPVYTRTPTMYLDFTLKPGAVLHQPVPEGWNAFVYVLEGEAIFGNVGSSSIGAHHTVLLSPGNGVSVWNKSNNPCRFVLIGGQPLNEPVVQYGPFVMNTKEEIIQAIQDYQHCKNGFERAARWHSDFVVLSEAD